MLKKPYEKDQKRLFTRAYGDRTRSEVFKLKEASFRLDIMMSIFFTVKVVRHLAQVVQRSCGCSITGSVQGHVGQGLEQPGTVEGVHGRGLNEMIFRIPSNQTHSCESMISLSVEVKVTEEASRKVC